MARSSKNALDSWDFAVLCDRPALVHRYSDSKSAVLSRIYSRAQSGSLLHRSVSPPRTILVLPSSYRAGPCTLDRVRDRRLRRVAPRLVGRAENAEKSVRLGIAIQNLRVLLADRPRRVLFDFAIEAAGLYPAR